MKKLLLLLILLLLLCSLAAHPQVEKAKCNVLFPVPTEVPRINFLDGEFNIYTNNNACIRILYTRHTGSYAEASKNVLVIVDVPEKENEWIVFVKKEGAGEEIEAEEYFEIHIKKSHFKRMDAVAKLQLTTRKLIQH